MNASEASHDHHRARCFADRGATATVHCYRAPAKINLLLRVLGRRSDGYHNLQTLFQFLDRGDRVSLRVRHDGQLRRTHGPAAIAVEDDLAMRAAALLQVVAECPLGADLGLDKQIPAGSGLGGGSSDAAAVLLALNHLWGTDLGIDQLTALGRRLGADVPLFVQRHAAWGEGVGDRLTPIVLLELWYVVVFPPLTVSTRAVFSAAELPRDAPPLTLAEVRGDFSSTAGVLDQRHLIAALEPRINDCEGIACALFPEVRSVLEWLNAFAPAHLSGSGGAVFAAFETHAQAAAVAARLPTDQGWTGWVAQGLNRSPLIVNVAPDGARR